MDQAAGSSYSTGAAQGGVCNMTPQDLFAEFESYRFSDDPEFRAGLPTVIAAIRGKERSADQIDEMIGRAQWFYFTRMKGLSIPWEDYARQQRTIPYVNPASPKAGLLLSRTTSPSTPKLKPHDALQTLNNLAEAKQMMSGSGGTEGGGGLSFAMLSRLIAEGRTSEVPVMHIPEGTNEGQPSRASMPARPKPWEMANANPLPAYHQPYRSYNSSPHNTSPTWATLGPTISPDLSTFDAITLDPDLSLSATGDSSANLLNTPMTHTASGSGSGSGALFEELQSDDTFANYLNMGMELDSGLAPPSTTGAFSSNSTPAPHAPYTEWGAMGNTPNSSHSL